MISFVAQSINLFVDSVVYLLALSAYVGQAIVTVLTGIFYFITGLLAFLCQVCEDNRSLFTLEVPSMVLDAPNLFITHFSEAADFLVNVFSGLHSVVIVPIIASAEFILLCIQSFVISVKNFSLIIGDSLWLIVTFIPVHLPSLVRTVSAWLLQASFEGGKAVYSSLLRWITYLTDVPLQSTAGIIFAVIIVRVIVDFKVEIISLLMRAYRSAVTGILFYYYSIHNYFADGEMRIINQLVGDRHRGLMGGEDVIEERYDRDALCVACQERNKCMLLLPCRHICLCCECCIRLYNYQRTCPICRTFICHSVNVYI